MSDLPVDLDAEAVLFEGHWYTRDDMARRIKAMLDAGDFNVGRPSQALEHLTGVLASVRTVAFRATPDLVEALNHAAQLHGKTVGNLIRDAVEGILAGVAPTNAPIPLSAVAVTPQSPQVHARPSAVAIPPVPPVPPAPAVPPVAPVTQPIAPVAGPGAMRNVGMESAPSLPSVVVDAGLTAEPVVELTQKRPQGSEEKAPTKPAESNWFKS